jgi:hypothetical protein
MNTNIKVEQSELKVVYAVAKDLGMNISWDDANLAVIRIRKTLPRGGSDDAQDFYDSVKLYLIN